MRHFLKSNFISSILFLRLWIKKITFGNIWRYLPRYLFPQTVVFYVSKDVLIMQRYRFWPFRSVIERNVWKIDASSQAHDIHAGLKLLKDVISASEIKICKVRLVLSGMLTFSVWLPWHDGIRFRDWKVLASQKFSQFYGVAVKEEIVIDDPPPGMGRLACVIKESVIQALNDHFGKIKLQCIQPFSVVAFNRWRHLFNKYDGWFVAIEPGVLHLMSISSGALNGLRSVQIKTGWENSFLTLLMREALLMGVTDANNMPGYIYWPEHPQFVPVDMAQKWVALASESDGAYGLAWCS